MNRHNNEELRNRAHAALLAHGRPAHYREIARMAGFGARNGSNLRYFLRGLARDGLVRRIDLGGSVQWEATRANRTAVPVDRATWTRTVIRTAGPLLSHGAARLADLMANYGDRDGTHIYARRQKLAEDMGVSPRQVTTYLDELRRLGVVACIKVEDSRNGLAAEYVLTDPTPVQLAEARRRRGATAESRRRGAEKAREAIRRRPRVEAHQTTGGSTSNLPRVEVHQEAVDVSSATGGSPSTSRVEVHQRHGWKPIRARVEAVQLTTRTDTPGPTTRTDTPGHDAQPTITGGVVGDCGDENKIIPSATSPDLAGAGSSGDLVDPQPTGSTGSKHGSALRARRQRCGAAHGLQPLALCRWGGCCEAKGDRRIQPDQIRDDRARAKTGLRRKQAHPHREQAHARALVDQGQAPASPAAPGRARA
jgi:hypothetical protein